MFLSAAASSRRDPALVANGDDPDELNGNMVAWPLCEPALNSWPFADHPDNESSPTKNPPSWQWYRANPSVARHRNHRLLKFAARVAQQAATRPWGMHHTHVAVDAQRQPLMRLKRAGALAEACVGETGEGESTARHPSFSDFEPHQPPRPCHARSAPLGTFGPRGRGCAGLTRCFRASP